MTGQDTTYALICEGQSCNPSLARVDRLIADLAKVHQAQIGTDELRAAQRQLVYTTHVMTAPVKARCLTCGTTRRYGSLTWETHR